MVQGGGLVVQRSVSVVQRSVAVVQSGYNSATEWL